MTEAVRRRLGRHLRTGAAAVVFISVLGTGLLYRHTLDYGFDYDDYHFIRPYSAAEVAGAFHGSWDAHGIETAYYRPLTIAFFAARFKLFGLDSSAHHAVSLTLFAAAAILLGTFVLAQTGNRGATVLTTAVFVAHPAMPYALVAWVTNQMHLIETIVVLLAVLWWHCVRARRLLLWLPLLALAAAAFLIKEDGVMLLPVIVGLHWLRRRLVEPALPPVPRSFVALAVVLLASLVLLRADALEGTRGRTLPSLEAAWQNFTRGLNGVLRLIPAHRPWQLPASWFATILPILGIACWRRTTPRVRYLLAAGALWTLAFNLPFVFVTKSEQMHLVAMGAVVVLSASAAALLEQMRNGAMRSAAVLLLAGGITTLAAVARHISTDFAPFGPIVLSHDQLVKDWAAVPEEVRDYLKRKLEPGAEARVPANPIEALDVVAFGLHPRETNPGGVSYQWMAQPSVEIHITRAARHIEIPLRHEIGAFREPADVTITADSRPADAMVLRDDQWRLSRTALRQDTEAWFQRWHRVRVTIPHTWRPSDTIPDSTDNRRLGLQVGVIQTR